MFKMITAAIATVCLAGSVQAAEILPGTASVGFTTGFTVDTATNTFDASNAFVTVANTTGGFATPNSAPFPFAIGTFDGTFSFSTTAGTTLAASLPNLLTFGNISFSAASVRTISYTVSPGTSTTGALYLLGTATNGTDTSDTSLTLSFNQTGNSAFSASATLATPPEPISPVPEPASWALMLAGFGAVGSALRSSRRKNTVSFG